MNYAGVRAIVTGGLGFIGSNLAIRLVQLGARVMIIDSLLEGCGGNRYNVDPVKDDIRIIQADISDAHVFAGDLRRCDVIFNLAGEISHVHSMQFPQRDLQVNTVAQLQFLIACTEAVPGVRIVYAGTRQIYSAPRYLPVDENRPVQPVDFNGVHRYATTAYHLMLTQAGLLDAAVLRLTNVYGPRMALDAVCQGFLSTYIRRVVLGQTLEIFGDGSQLRDPVYVDDAVEAFLAAGRATPLRSRCYNAGGPEVHSVAAIARIASELAGCPDPVFKPFPPDRKSIDIGSYYTDSRNIAAGFGWVPATTLRDGLRRTLDYYRAELPHYLDLSQPDPPCRMPEHSGVRRSLRYVATGD